MVFLRLTPAQSTGIHGWGPRLKTTLTWADVAEHEDIDFDLLLQMGLEPRDLHRLQEDVQLWVRHAGVRPAHMLHMLPWPAHPLDHLGGDLSDIMALRPTSRQLRTMGVTYPQLRDAGMTPETMRLLGITFQGWIDLGLTHAHTRAHFTDAQLGRVFQMTRQSVDASFRAPA